MKVSEAYGPGKLGLSFELFPPKTEAGEQDLFRNLAHLMEFSPSYVTCTYGAGGSTRAKTLDIVQRARQKFGCSVASHLTCVGSTVAELKTYLAEARERGVENIVALRGDPPRGETSFRPVAGGLSFANEMVALVRGEFPEFGIAVAGYPETHREAASPEADIANLRRKVDAGADVVITQLFYANADFFRFRDVCARSGIRVPIVPGILPVTSLTQIQRITSLCGAQLPSQFVESLSAHGDDATGQFEVGVEFAAAQVQELLKAGAPGVHFYVLNKSQATVGVLERVGLKRETGVRPG